jgi:hypothetical protein
MKTIIANSDVPSEYLLTEIYFSGRLEETDEQEGNEYVEDEE